MNELRQQIEEAVRAVSQRSAGKPPPAVGIILGTGLGQLGSEIEDSIEVPYTQVPHFPTSTVESHTGNLIVGRLEGVPVVAMKGRFHAYEGYSPTQITFGVRVMKSLGVHTLLVSNACGGMNPQYEPGDLMLIDDHINLMGFNPLVGVNDPELGLRFPDMCQPYDPVLTAKAHAWALEQHIQCHIGVYVGVTGPCLETRAEYRFLRGIGADVVGMSTVPEVIVAVQAGLRVVGLSIVTDKCIPEILEPVSIEKVIAVAMDAEPRMTKVMRFLMREIAGEGRADASAPEASSLAAGEGDSPDSQA